jgi:hypothetical protein
MALDLTILQKPLDVTESHSDHTWNIALNDYSAYTDVRLIVDIYVNPYQNDYGSPQVTGKKSRLLVPPNQFGNCIFNVETIIRNFTKGNPRNMTMIYDPTGPTAINNPYQVDAMQSNLLPITANTSQATIASDRQSTVGFSNGFNGASGFEDIYHINEYRCIFGIQYTSAGSTSQIIDTTRYNVYSGWTGQSISPLSAETQPYGVTIWPGVQDNKQYGVSSLSAFTYYYSATNLTGQYNYLNTKVFDYAMNTGVAPYNQPGKFMGVFGPQTIPMTAFGGPLQQTRFRSHYYTCPIILGFMYGENQLYDNSSVVSSITYLQKTQGNGQYNYDVAQSVPIAASTNPTGYFSLLGQRIAYTVLSKNPLVNTLSDVAIYLSSGTCDPSGVDRVSEIVQYKMMEEECFNDPYSFLFLNRNGVWDTFTFTKKSQKTYQPKRNVYGSQKTLNTTTWNRQSYDAYETVYYGQADEMFTFDSGYVYQNDRDIIEQLLLSPYVYMIMDDWTPQPIDGDCSTVTASQVYPYLIPVTVMNSEVEVFQQKYQRIFQYTLEVKQTPYRKYEMPI